MSINPNAEPLPDWARLYLGHLGLECQTAGYSYLSQLCRAHLEALPFENVSKLVQADSVPAPALPSPAMFVQNALLYQYGGTCYSLHASFLALLRALGFEAHLVLVGSDHAAIIVKLPELDGEPVYVDIGSAAPLFQPVRFESEPDNCARFGPEAVCIAADSERPGRYRYIRYRHGSVVSDRWHFHPGESREPSDFTEEVTRSFVDGSMFLSCLRIHLFQLDRSRSVSLKNNSLFITYADGREERTSLGTIEEIEEALAAEFGLPRLPVRQAAAILSKRGIDIFSENA